MCYRFYSMHVVYQLNLQLKLSFLLFHFFFFSTSKNSCLWVSVWVDLLLWWRTCCTPLDWGTVGALTCWSLAGIFPLVFSPSPPAGEVAAVRAGWPCAHADFGTGLDMQSFTWVLGSFSILPTPEYHQHVSSRTEEPLTCCWELFFSLFL